MSRNVKSNSNDIGDRLKYLRKEVFRMSQAQFAKPLSLTQGAWGLIESGARNLTTDKLKQIVLFYKVRTDWLITGGNDIFDPNRLDASSLANRLIILRNHSRRMGNVRNSASLLDVNEQEYKDFEFGKVELPKIFINKLYEVNQPWLSKEWWYEGKGNIFKPEHDPLTDYRSPESYPEPPEGVDFMPGIPVKFEKEELSQGEISNLEREIEDILRELKEDERADHRAIYAAALKLKLKKLGLFLE